MDTITKNYVGVSSVNFQKDSLSNKIFRILRDKIVFMEYPPVRKSFREGPL